MEISDIPHMFGWMFIYLGLSFIMVNVLFMAVQFIVGFTLGFYQALRREIRNGNRS